MSQAPQRVVVATAGHVDHGKTRLIHALTGTDTDRLPDEKRRGISIELGFAELPDSNISFVDVPGHEGLVHTMIAGVGGVDAVLLVVAADDGVMPQTREHLQICRLLGLERIVVALTKVDLVDQETRQLAELDIRDTLGQMGLSATALVATSETTGEGLARLREALFELAGQVTPRTPSNRLWLAVDRVFTIKGAGTVVTGTLTRGQVAVGDTLYAVKAHASGSRQAVIATHCRNLEVHGRQVTRVTAPARVALNLGRVDLGEVQRGDVITRDQALPCPDRVDVTLEVVPGAADALARRRPIVMHVGTTRVTARAVWLADGLAQLLLERPVPCEGGLGFVLRGGSSSQQYGRVLAGGRILDSQPDPLPRAKREPDRQKRMRTLRAIEQGSWPEAVRGLLELTAPRPLTTRELERRLGLDASTVTTNLQADSGPEHGAPVALDDGESWTLQSAITRLVAALEESLRQYHESQPHEPGLSLQSAREELGRRGDPLIAARVIEVAITSGRVCLEQGRLSLPAFLLRTRPLMERHTREVLAAIQRLGLAGVREEELGQHTAIALPSVRSALQQLAVSQAARRLGNLWFAETRLNDLRRDIRAYFKTHETLSVVQFKDVARVTRKQAIPLLEQLDREGTTRRRGDVRVAGKAPPTDGNSD